MKFTYFQNLEIMIFQEFSSACVDSNILIAKFENFECFRTFLILWLITELYRKKIKKWVWGGGGDKNDKQADFLSCAVILKNMEWSEQCETDIW